MILCLLVGVTSAVTLVVGDSTPGTCDGLGFVGGFW